MRRTQPARPRCFFASPAAALAAALVLVPFLPGCSAAPNPRVPVTGAPGAVARLAGTWVGDYRLADGTRHGSIVFRLDEGDSLARGDVLMLPGATAEDTRDATERMADARRERRPADALAITFVAVEGERVRGTLAPYRDPDCLCEVRTAFEGRVDGDVIEGTFTIDEQVRGRTRAGRWSVRRQG